MTVYMEQVDILTSADAVAMYYNGMITMYKGSNTYLIIELLMLDTISNSLNRLVSIMYFVSKAINTFVSLPFKIRATAMIF